MEFYESKPFNDPTHSPEALNPLVGSVRLFPSEAEKKGLTPDDIEKKRAETHMRNQMELEDKFRAQLDTDMSDVAA